jgi:orotidine-5'-phosphate decarboxylase
VAARAGIAGLVCSPHEIEAARDVSRSMVLVVPGIRPVSGDGAVTGDQKRVGTAAEAFRRGADYIVVGRPVRDAREPAAAFAALVRDAEAHA